MTLPPLSSDEPASAVQLGAAMAAPGLYDGTNTAAEHAAEAARLGGTARTGCAWPTRCSARSRSRR
ncbi:hypothetical protein [Streptosporangium roseum]|uniref:hypothetical protein n=1 Tax=Streptosporangium roseum TaxID=2001 RepID=UPI00331B03E8